MIFIQLRPYIMYKRNIFRASALVLLYLHVFKKSVQRKTTVLISVDHMILKLSFFAEFFFVACRLRLLQLQFSFCTCQKEW